MGGLLFFFEARNTPPIHDKSLSDTLKPQLYDKNMPEKLNRKLKLDALTLNQQQVQAADHLGMSRRSVQRAKAKLENYSESKPRAVFDDAEASEGLMDQMMGSR